MLLAKALKDFIEYHEIDNQSRYTLRNYHRYVGPFVEWLASGTPVVALAGTAPAEVVRPGLGRVAEPTPAALAEACEAMLDLASSAEVAADCRAAAWTWDWRTAIVPRLLRLYHHQL